MKLNVLREPAKYRAWVCRIAKNCAKNMVTRYRSFLSLEEVDRFNLKDEYYEDPHYLYAESEEKEKLHNGIGKLPEKVRDILVCAMRSDLRNLWNMPEN